MLPNSAMSTINLRQIEAFIGVIESGSVTRAAEAMHITQSAASRLLQRLESDLGFALFVRVAGRMTPTEDAKALYVEAQRSFIGMRQIEQAAQRIRDIGTGTLRICVMPTLQQGVLPGLVAEFCRLHPGISVLLDVQSHHDVVHSVLRGVVEIGFATVPLDEPKLAISVLSERAAVCLVPASHPLAAKRRIRIEDLRDVEYINVPGARFRDQIDRLFAEHDVRRRMRIDARTILAATALVASGAGVSIVDPFSLESIDDSRLAARPLLPSFNVQVGAFHNTLQPLSIVARKFLEHCERSVQGTNSVATKLKASPR